MTKHLDEDVLAAFDRKMSRSITAHRNLRSLRDASDEKVDRKKGGEREDSEERGPPFKPFYDK